MILAPISIGDLADKISILQIKARRITDPEKLANVGRELEALRAAWAEACGPRSSPVTLAPMLRNLDSVNNKLWDLENEARKPKYVTDDMQFLTQKDRQDMAALLRSITRNNDTRAALKRAISKLMGSELTEEKSHTT